MQSWSLCVLDIFLLGNEWSEKLLISHGPPDAQHRVSFFCQLCKIYTFKKSAKSIPFKLYITHAVTSNEGLQKLYSLIFKR